MNTTASPIPIASAFRDSVESVVVVVDVAVVLVLVLVLVDMVVGGKVETAASHWHGLIYRNRLLM